MKSRSDFWRAWLLVALSQAGIQVTTRNWVYHKQEFESANSDWKRSRAHCPNLGTGAEPLGNRSLPSIWIGWHFPPSKRRTEKKCGGLLVRQTVESVQFNPIPGANNRIAFPDLSNGLHRQICSIFPQNGLKRGRTANWWKRFASRETMFAELFDRGRNANWWKWWT
jgi:hypothetical protein